MPIIYVPPSYPFNGNLWEINPNYPNNIQTAAGVDGIVAPMPGAPEMTFAFRKVGTNLQAIYNLLSGGITAIFGVLYDGITFFGGARYVNTATFESVSIFVNELFEANLTSEDADAGIGSTLKYKLGEVDEMILDIPNGRQNTRTATANSEERVIEEGVNATGIAQEPTIIGFQANNNTDATAVAISVPIGLGLLQNNVVQFRVSSTGAIFTNQVQPLSGVDDTVIGRIELFDPVTFVSLGFLDVRQNP